MGYRNYDHIIIIMWPHLARKVRLVTLFNVTKWYIVTLSSATDVWWHYTYMLSWENQNQGHWSGNETNMSHIRPLLHYGEGKLSFNNCCLTTSKTAHCCTPVSKTFDDLSAWNQSCMLSHTHCWFRLPWLPWRAGNEAMLLLTCVCMHKGIKESLFVCLSVCQFVRPVKNF